MKSTLFCMHVMPHEIEMLERFMKQYRKALSYLDDTDNFTMKVSLNLNPNLTNWEDSELKQDYFVDKFNTLFDGIKNINQIHLDDSLWGTTQQKRESIKLLYDQFIFCDADILLHEHLLKYQLNASYQIHNQMYIISPAIPKWWDTSWDVITHSGLIDKPLGYAHSQEAVDNAFTQNTDDVSLVVVPMAKFGCGMHTLYSRTFWNWTGIPESFGGYGPEDTYGMNCIEVARKHGFEVNQYFLDGIYITEDYINTKPSFDGKVVRIDKKREFYDKAHALGRDELIKFAKRILNLS
jgi:hypothetical protein